MLEPMQLIKLFGDTTADDSGTLDIPNGQRLGVIGRSGAGKSSLRRMINRLGDRTRGSIAHGGREIGMLKGRALREPRNECAVSAVQPRRPARCAHQSDEWAAASPQLRDLDARRVFGVGAGLRDPRARPAGHGADLAQILRVLISPLLYSFESSTRTATILGLVGAGASG